MITLLASIAGFIGSIVPELLRLLKDKNDKKHELQILNLQLEQSKHTRNKIIEEINTNKDLQEISSLYSTYKSGICWVDALNGTVRPMLAYSFFVMYGFVKFLQYKMILLTAPLIEYIDIIWTLEDQAIFAGIISFYFGQRTFSKLHKKIG